MAGYNLYYNASMRRTKALFIFILAVILLGCAEVPQEVKHFEPLADSPLEKVFLKDNVPSIAYEDAVGKITASIFEYNTILAVPISITNKLSKDELPTEYSISLADGRDLKPIKMLKRDDLIKIKAKYLGEGSSNLEDQLLEATVTNIMNVANMPTKDRVVKLLDEGINSYFAFRPIYAGEKREGVLCFLPDFKLEYPLTLMVKVRGEKIDFKFFPKER